MSVSSILGRMLPKSARRWLVRHMQWPPVGRVKFESLRRLTPVSRAWGGGRGLPVDRYYIERFLERHATDIRGRGLEVKDNIYTRRFGGSRVTQSDVLHRDVGREVATIIADLASADHIPSESFDFIICTQTLHLIFELQAAVETLHRILKPGGVLLATVPGISQICRPAPGDSWHDCWRFTAYSAQALFEQHFLPGRLEVEANGNVLTAVALLHGLAAEELTESELEHQDADYQVLITVRAVK